MSEQSKFELAQEIANKISSQCNSEAESKELIKLIKELLDVRWAIPSQSS